MDIKDAALSLNQFDRTLSKMPNNTLKRALKQHVHDAYQLLLEECLQRNTSRNCRLHDITTDKRNINIYRNKQLIIEKRYMKSS